MPEGFTFTLCADDYALSPAVSRGIREALAAGRLTATGAMTTRPSWPQAARELKALGADADVGLHFNLTLGAPLTKMPRLAPEGRLPTIATLMRLSRRGALPTEEIAAELAAQMDAYVAWMGREPDFLDGHQHVQILSGVRGLVFDQIRQRRLEGRMWLRSSGDWPWRILARRHHLPKALGVAWLAGHFHWDANNRGLATNDGFAGFSDFSAKTDYATMFERYLAAPGRRHLVMCHPGYVDDELRSLDPATDSREQELAFLLSDRFLEILARRSARLTRLKP